MWKLCHHYWCVLEHAVCSYLPSPKLRKRSPALKTLKIHYNLCPFIFSGTPSQPMKEFYTQMSMRIGHCYTVSFPQPVRVCFPSCFVWVLPWISDCHIVLTLCDSSNLSATLLFPHRLDMVPCHFHFWFKSLTAPLTLQPGCCSPQSTCWGIQLHYMCLPL